MRSVPVTLAIVAILVGCSGGSGEARRSDSGAPDASDGGDGDSGTTSFDSGQGGATDGGDGDAGSDGGPIIPGVVSISVSATEITLDSASDGTQTDITATATFEDGSTADVTDQVHWSVDDERLGSIVDGVFVSSGIGGSTVIRVQAGGLEDVTIPITIVVDITFELEEDLPAGATDMFPSDLSGDDTSSADSPVVIYPSHETMFPRNIQRVMHQWTHGPSLDLFEVRFDSDVAHIKMVTTRSDFTPDAETWRVLAESHAGRSLTFSVRGVTQADPSTVYRSQDVTLHYSEADVAGALFYWSTGAEGVMRATIDAPLATKFYTDPMGDSADTCVSCHTVSRNGQRMVGGYDGEKLHSIAMDGRTVEVDTGDKFGWGTFDPPADKLLYASEGSLRLLDAATGTVLVDEVDLGVWSASHPDWAPSGDFVAVTVSESELKNKDVEAASIGRISVDDNGEFGAVEVLVTPDDVEGADNLFFPAVSPDSRWIAFVAGTGKSKDDQEAEIYVIPAAGGTPQALPRMNRRVRDARGNHDTNLNLGNSMPTWAPMTAKGTYWLAFSSLRAYADVRPADDKEDQLWAAALDPDALGTDADPSFAAFWMPFQQIDEGNHRVFWVVNTEEECPGITELCSDDLDNDCDGEVDEVGCCEPVQEMCGDEVDNDCDGVVDEGCLDDCTGTMCECDSSETGATCEDGVDNDCDGDIDENDSDCIVIVI